VLLGALLSARQACAQEHALPSAPESASSSRLAYAVKGVLFDPTTYMPALLGFDATMRDWKTSQPFFAQGFVEKNERFTVSGLPYDRAISYEAGRGQIVRDAFSVLEVSAIQNLTERLTEHALLRKFPEHQKMVKAIGWFERISVASLVAYHVAAPHYSQWRLNQSMAVGLGD
jgi:hypothetical protein